MTGDLLAAVRGAIGFLSRIPLGRTESDWAAFERTPTAFPLSGYAIGATIAVPIVAFVALGLPPATVAVAGMAAIYGVTGINHLDGLLDLGDAAAVHGGPEDRVEVLKDTTVGVGALALAILGLLALGFGVFELAAVAPIGVLTIVVAAEVGAKLTMAGIACFGTARHEGLGATFTSNAEPGDLVVPAAVSLPIVALGVPTGAPFVAAAALAGAVAGGTLFARWASELLAGVNGDVFGAANEVARIVGIHVGVIAWTLS